MGQLLERVLNQRGVLDLGRMCIVPRRTCWVLHVDVVVLGFGGNVTDAMFMAVRAALHNTRIPQLVIDPSVGTGDGPGANGSAAEYELLADEQAMVRLDIGCVPLCVTLSKVGRGDHAFIGGILLTHD